MADQNFLPTIPPIPRLQKEWYEAIGRVAANAAHWEFSLGQIITRLSGVTETKGFALVRPYNLDMRLKKIEELLEFWKDQPLGVGTKTAIDELATIMSDANTQRIRKARNDSVHGLWFGVEDPTIFTQFRNGVPAHYTRGVIPIQRVKFLGRPVGQHVDMEIVDLQTVIDLAEEIWNAAAQIRSIIPRLPFAGD